MKKIALTFCCVLSFLCFFVSSPAEASATSEATTSFTDISGWYEPYITDLTGQGILEGRTETEFFPNATITRTEFITILARLSGDDLNAYRMKAPSFKDIATTYWGLSYIEWGYENKVIVGDNNGNFNPSAQVTRQDIAVMLCRYAQRVEGVSIRDLGGHINFTDAGAIALYAQDSVDTLVRGGLINGYEDSSFRPKNPTSRGEAAKLISIFLDEVPGYKSLGYTWGDLKYFIHAGGEINGQDFTNSQEALENCLSHGQRFIEMDFLWTSDGHLVSLRHWDYVNPKRGALTYNEFMSMKIFGGLTPVSLDSLCAWLRQHDGVYIITDIKEDNLKGLSLISGSYRDVIDRFIPQIYSTSEYDTVAGLGFRDIILTTYNMYGSDVENVDNLIAFAQNHPLLAITIDEYYAKQKDYVDALGRSGVLLGVFTINDASAVQYYFNQGIDVIYTDKLDLQ